MNKKVVVFGALGLVGRSVIKALESRSDWQIRTAYVSDN